jgi:acyl-CoA synthetase (AMP-forming)/AMP-acid ligase II
MIRGEGHVLFGSTEVEPVSGISAADYVACIETTPSQRPLGLCVGNPVPQLGLQLIQPVDGAIPAGTSLASLAVPAGEIGEIVVSGSHVLPSYLNDDIANRETIHVENGRLWRRTGDCASLDDDGRLWLVGRLSQRVRGASGTLWPIPVELDALSVSFVQHAALIRSTDVRETPERAVLCVEVPVGLTPERLTLLRRAVARWTIDEIVAVPRIPRDPRHHTKTDTVALRRLLGK